MLLHILLKSGVIVEMLDIISYNKAVIGLNKARKANDRIDNLLDRKIHVRTIVFVLAGVAESGVHSFVIPFEYSGNIIDMKAVCKQQGASQSLFTIEKKACEAFATPSLPWDVVGKLYLDQYTSEHSLPYELYISEVIEGDHFRVEISEAGEGVEDITIQILIET